MDLEVLAALLDEIEPHVLKRKPKLCKEPLEKILAAAWPKELQPEITDLKKWIGKYKFKEAREVLDSLRDNLKAGPA